MTAHCILSTIDNSQTGLFDIGINDDERRDFGKESGSLNV